MRRTGFTGSLKPAWLSHQHVQLSGNADAAKFEPVLNWFMQHDCIAGNAERCNTFPNSVRLSHAVTLSRRMKIELCGFQYEVTKKH